MEAGDWIPAPYRVRGRLFAGMTVWCWVAIFADGCAKVSAGGTA